MKTYQISFKSLSNNSKNNQGSFFSWRYVIGFIILSWGNVTFAQVGIGTTTPNSSAQLEIKANDKGLLIPQVALQSTTDAVTILNGNVSGLTVFNTNTISDVTPGYYFWYNNQWKRILSENILSTLVDNGNGTYTYTNENGLTTLVNVIQDMYDYGDTVLSNATFITNMGDVLSNNQTFIDSLIANGDFITDVWNTFITDNTLINNLGNVLVSDTTFINNLGNVLDNDTTFINNLGDVLVSDTSFINNLGDVLVADTNFITSIGNVLIADSTFISNLVTNITTSQQFLNFLEQFVTDFETNTTLVDNGDGTATFTNEDGVVSIINFLKSASNGLTATAGDVKLGGAITQPTTISALTTTNKLSFTGTGLDAINFANNTLSVDATNNRIGIGTTTPAQSLTIAGTNALGVDNSTTFSAKNNAGNFETFLHPRWSDDVMYLNFGANGFNIRNNSAANVMFMSNNGNVGIGTLSPLDKFHLEGGNMRISQGNGLYFPHTAQTDANDGRIGAGLFTDGLNIVGVQTVAGQGRRTTFFGDINLFGGTFLSNGNPGGAGQVLTSTGATTSPTWQTPTVPIVPSEPWKVVGSGADATLNTQNIYQLGNIGIGTTTPGAKLDVIQSSTPFTINAIVSRSTAGDFSLNTYTGVSTSNTNDIMNQFGQSYSLGGMSEGFDFIRGFGGADGELAFRTQTQERLRIKSNGRVGIGTSNPAAKLDIAGDIKISGGSPGAGKILTSDATGLASWENLDLNPQVAIKETTNGADFNIQSLGGATDIVSIWSAYIAPKTGWYAVNTHVNVMSADKRVYKTFLVNGLLSHEVIQHHSGSNNEFVTFDNTKLVYLAENDQLEVKIWNYYPSSLSQSTSYPYAKSTLEIYRIGN